MTLFLLTKLKLKLRSEGFVNLSAVQTLQWSEVVSHWSLVVPQFPQIIEL